MKRLEEHLGFPLFERTGRSAVLNEAGLRVLTKAQTILSLIDKLGDADDAAQGPLVKIGAISSVQSSMLARARGLHGYLQHCQAANYSRHIAATS